MREANTVALSLTVSEQLFRVWSEAPRVDTAKYLYASINISTTLATMRKDELEAATPYLLGEIDALVSDILDNNTSVELERITRLLMVLVKRINITNREE